MNPDEIKLYLNDFSNKHNLIEYAKESSTVSIKELIKDGGSKELGTYAIGDLVLAFDYQSFIFNDYLRKTPWIRTRIGIYVNDPDNNWVKGLKPIGYYELDTDVKGEHFDDWLIINEQ